MTGGCGNHLSPYYTHQLICQGKVFLLIRAVIGYLGCVCLYSFSSGQGGILQSGMGQDVLLDDSSFILCMLLFPSRPNSKVYTCVLQRLRVCWKKTLCKWVHGSRLTGVKWLGRYGFLEIELKITLKRSNST